MGCNADYFGRSSSTIRRKAFVFSVEDGSSALLRNVNQLTHRITRLYIPVDRTFLSSRCANPKSN
jgi:hypothetical protein